MKPMNSNSFLKRSLMTMLTTIMSLMSWAAVGDMFTINTIEYEITSENPKEVKVRKSSDKSTTGDLVIPASVTFMENEYAVTSIGKMSFNICSGLTTVTIPYSVTYIGEDAFFGCTSVTDVYCFADLTALTWEEEGCDDFKASKGTKCHVFSLSEWNFVDIVNLEAVGDMPKTGEEITTNNLKYMVTDQKTGTVSVIGYDEKPIGDLVIPAFVNGFIVTGIGTEAFSYCKDLTSVTIPASMTSIEADAFYACTEVTNVYCLADPSILEWNDNYGNDFMLDKNTACHVASDKLETFKAKWSTGVKATDVNVKFVCDEVNLGDLQFWVTSKNPNEAEVCGYIGKSAGDLVIPATINIMGDDYAVTGIATDAFYNCTSLTSVTIPESVTTIGYRAFQGCIDLKSVTIPNGLKTISDYAFASCNILTSVTIPASVTKILSYAFYCSKLSSVRVGWTTPIVIFESSFYYKTNATLYVPRGTKSTYENTFGFKDFKNIVEYDQCATPVISYKGGKLYFECETEDVEYHVSMETPKSLDTTGNGIDVPSTYVVKVYASKDGYYDSDVAKKEIDIRGLKGDVDGDGVVDVNDVQTTINIILKK